MASCPGRRDRRAAVTAEPRVRRALVSVSDKHGIEELARSLHALGIELVSTGGTARLLARSGLPVTEVSALTGFPEIMAGRVKTLHPKVHGGLLGRRGTDERVMERHGIAPIDLLVVNLYPFERTVADPGCHFDEAVENIDIGGPAMLRAAAKNHAAVAVVCEPGDYPRVAEELRRNRGRIGSRTRFELAAKAFAHTARYDGAIANFLGSIADPGRHPLERSPFPRFHTRQAVRHAQMRYGENPHQAAAFYRDPDAPDLASTVAGARLAQGKPLSFNNVADADTALECVGALGAEEPACVIVKHANPCGAATAATTEAAYDGAFRTDPTSAFGGIVTLNRALDGKLARVILERQFVEVIVVPGLGEGAETVLAGKPDVRVLVTAAHREPAAAADRASGGLHACLDVRSVRGGLLLQEADHDPVTPESLEVVTRRAPARAELADLLFAWRVAWFVKSNAIVYAAGGATRGIGGGQSSRVYSARIARLKAHDEGLDLDGAVMASDAFFPFRDGIDAAAEAGIAAVIQPGGSRRDAEVIEAADEHAMAMVFTGVRHFRH